MRTLGAVLAGIAVLVTAACAPPARAVNKPDVAKSIRETEAALAKAYAAKDLKQYIAFFEPEAIIAATGMPPITGAPAISKGTAALFADPHLKEEFAADHIEVADAGDLAVAHGRYRQTATRSGTGEPAEEHGSYATVFRRQPDGSWKIAYEISATESAK
jgi:uncharacterized protein (TIGR02246 family)